MRPVRFTKEGYEELKKEHADLLSKRPAAVDDLQKARELGDLSENGFYKAARSKLSATDSKLRRLTMLLKRAVIIENGRRDIVDIGATVKVLQGEKESTYHIVGDTEADPMHGKISLYSPIGRALVGRRVGDSVTIETPKGNIALKILSIS